MSIKNRIENPPEVRENVIEHEGHRYKIRGTNDANVLCRSIALPPPQAETLAKHWKAVIGKDFDTDTVRNVNLVHACLVPETYDPETETWTPDPVADDVTDIAKLAVTDGILFTLLMGACYFACGMDRSSTTNILEEVAVGN